MGRQVGVTYLSGNGVVLLRIANRGRRLFGMTQTLMSPLQNDAILAVGWPSEGRTLVAFGDFVQRVVRLAMNQITACLIANRAEVELVDVTLHQSVDG